MALHVADVRAARTWIPWSHLHPAATQLVSFLPARAAASMTPEDRAAKEAQMTACKNDCFEAVATTTLHVYDKHIMPSGEVQALTKQRVKTHINQ